MFPRWLRQLVKKSPLLVAMYRPFSWRLHLLQDWWGTKVWTRTREVTTPLGFKLTSGLHPAYEQMRRGEFEPAETRLLAALMDEADCFVDIGANLGYYTCLSLQKGVPAIAFEPQPQNLRCLYQNLVANGWDEGAEVFPMALSDTPGLLTLYGASGPSASLVKGWAGYSARHRQTVPVNTLDHVLGGRLDGKRLLVKIDVEGAEFGVIKGALATVQRSPRPAWLLEVCLQEFHPDGANPDFIGIFRLFWQNGYRAYAAGTPLRALAQDEVEGWWREGRTSGQTFNYLFLAEDRRPPD